jgi:uroporphyrinogen decarboxylase
MTPPVIQAEAIHDLPPRELWTEAARRRRDAYAITPGAPFLKTEFGFFCWEQWKQQGMPDIEPGSPEAQALFHYDDASMHGLWSLGWCEPEYVPQFEVKILEDRGETELEQDWAGRHVLYFKGRRNGFMPEYIDHPVKDPETWKANAEWRLDPRDPRRYQDLKERMGAARAAAARGEMITQHVAGSFMFLRAMLGPEALLYTFVDQPELIETIMQRWLELADAVTAAHQQYITFDEIYFAEDNCYNHGPLISPDMTREMLLPYYKELLRRVRQRQIDQSRHLYVQIDTDGKCEPLIAFYMKEIGMDAMSPFEVASGCDVVEIGRRFPGLCMRGGIDKRVLAAGPKAIDAMVERIFPVMRKRGGYIPCCDHGVPAEVPYASYLHYRRRCVELGE